MKKRRVFKALSSFALTLFLFQAGTATAQETPSEIVAGFQNNVLAVMKDADQLDVRGRFERLEPGIESSFHIPFMVQIATGRHWKSAAREERRELVNAFRRMSIATLATLFSGYKGEVFERNGEKAGPKKTTLVITKLIKSDKSSVDITYVTRKFKAGWRVIDVVVNNGISELKVRRSEYNKVLNEKGVPGLIDQLNGKADELMAK